MESKKLDGTSVKPQRQQNIKPDYLEDLKQKGIDAFIEEDLPLALSCFTRAIEHDPKNAILYSNRSATHSAMKKFKEALEDAEKTISLKKTWAKGYYRKGNAYEQLLCHSKAQDAYQAGLKINPNDPSLLKAAEELSILLEEIKIKEADAKKNGVTETDKFEGMVKWLLAGGATFPKLYMKYYSQDYRGVHCQSSIYRDEILLYVPFKYLMTSEVAKESSIGRSIIRSNVDIMSKHSYLAAYLLQEKHRKRSFWRPYLNILPQYYANVPIFFKEDLLSSLKGSFSLQKIADRIDSLRTEYDNIRQYVREFNTFHLDEFIWARLVVITRIFGFIVDRRKTDGLVPYADMLNHKMPRETSWTFDADRYGFIITALKTYKKEDEVFDSYGRKCNHRYFVNYGFAVDNNEDNEAVIQVEIPQDDPIYTMKIKHLHRQHDRRRREFQIPSNYNTEKCKQLFSFMRFVHAQEEELIKVSSSQTFSVDKIGPISIRNEMAALKAIGSICEKRLQAFEHSLDYDYKLLDSGKLEMYSNERNAIIMRRGEKQVLTWFINLATLAQNLFTKPLKELKGLTSTDIRVDRHRCHKSSGPMYQYVRSVIIPLVRRSSS